MTDSGIPPDVARGACPTGSAGTDIVDVILDLDASCLPAGHEIALLREVLRFVPWLAAEPRAGIHPVRGTRCADGSLLVSRRTKLVIRMPRDKLCAASNLEGASLDLAGTAVRIGHGTFRRLKPSATVYSPRVTTGDEDEIAFVDTLGRELGRLAVKGRLLCGRRTRITRDGREIAAWSVAVHELAAEHSLALQRQGLGLMRDVGCGILSPHKTIHTAD
ncbi:MAG: type I-MYXAN CRISPR-associated protein Cas6/Cmx6 [Betaproteobacteria bacterium]|nr:type I-MYXAN CRISPR-associated protein Cas6/Cmx6 [Betaproteobacteria bacterium]